MRQTTYKFRQNVLFAVFVSVFSFFSKGQFVIDFEIEGGSNICTPTSKKFKNLSTYNGISVIGNPNLVYKWTIESISSPSNKAEPVLPFNTTGNLDVKLEIQDTTTGESSFLERKDYIIAYQAPIPDFSVNKALVCAPSTIKVTDKSIIAGGLQADSYEWVISGVGTKTTKNPEFIIDFPGKYNLYLKIQDENGCATDTTAFEIIHVLPQPTANFTSAGSIVACDPPLNISLSGVDDPSFTYNWNITPSIGSFSGRNIDLTITNSGKYSVSLQVEGHLDCSFTKNYIDTIVVEKPDPNFELPDTNCKKKEVQFVNKSPSGTHFSWNFDEGNEDVFTNEDTVFTFFTQGGNHNITLTARLPDSSCATTKVIPFLVDNTTLDFKADKIRWCESPFKVNFDNTSYSNYPADSELKWRFEHDSTDVENPSYTYVSYSDATIHYSISLSVETPFGCKDTIVKENYISIAPINVKMELPDQFIPVIEGCAPLEVPFDSKIANNGWSISSITWELVDGTIESGKNSFTHTFDHTPQDGFSKVIITTPEGCSDVDSTYTRVGLKPVPQYTFTPYDICSSDSTLFFDNSYVEINGVKEYDRVERWEWDFGIGQVSSKEQNPIVMHSDSANHSFENVEFDVKLVANYFGCKDSIIESNVYKKKGPASTIIEHRIDCSSLNVADGTVNVEVKTALDAFTSFEWIWPGGGFTFDQTAGTGIPPAKDLRIIKDTLKGIPVNPIKGTKVFLKSYNSQTGCTDIDSIEVGMPLLNSSISGGTICLYDANILNKRNTFRVNLLGYPEEHLDSISWIIDGEEVGSNQTSYRFTIPREGSIDMRAHVFAKDDGCTVFLQNTLEVKHPDIGVALESGHFKGCPPLRLDVIGDYEPSEKIEPDKTHWQLKWKYPPPDTALITAMKTVNPKKWVIQDTGTYQILIDVTDEYGCRAIYEDTNDIIVGDPQLEFSMAKTGYCLGDSIQVNANVSFSGMEYEWKLSDGTISNDSVPIIYFNKVDTMDVYLTIGHTESTCELRDTIRNAIYVDPIPAINFDVSKTSTTCPPLNTSLNSTISPNFNGYNYFWFVEDETTFFTDTVPLLKSVAGIYDIKLLVETDNGRCADSIFRPDILTVNGPSAKVSQSSDTICVGDSIIFTLTDLKNVNEISWVYGDGDSELNRPPTEAIKQHFYYTTGLKPATIFLDPNNCNVPLNVPVFVYQLKAGLQLPDDTLCGPGTVLIKDTSQTFGHIFTWDFGDGSPSNSDSSSIYKYYDEGYYEIILSIEDTISSCANTDTVPLWVFNKPNAQVSFTDSVLCAGEFLQLSVTGSQSYKWFPNFGLNKDNISNPKASPATSTMYYVHSLDHNLCPDIDSVWVGRDISDVNISLQEDTVCGNLFLNSSSLNNFSQGNNQLWEFDNTNTYFGIQPNYIYPPGSHTLKVTVYDLSPRCKKDTSISVLVKPLPPITKSNDTIICKTGSAQISVTGGDDILWQTSLPSEPVPVGYTATVTPTDSVMYYLEVKNFTTGCSTFDSIMVDVDITKALFDILMIDSCSPGLVELENIEPALHQKFNFGDGTSLTDYIGGHSYKKPGVYTIKYVAKNKLNDCADSTFKTLEIFSNPTVFAFPDTILCIGDSVQMWAFGAENYKWYPTFGLSDSLIPNPVASISRDVNYYVIGYNEKKCADTARLNIKAFPEYTYNSLEDTTIVVAEKINLDLNPNMDLNITWSPNQFLMCDTCDGNFDIKPTQNICYTINMIDSAQCYPKTEEVCIFIEHKYSLDVADVFTPNGDGNNDKVYLRGWGIKELQHFTIYNRWGEVVFQTNQLEQGWDGKYKGVIQNDETYVYRARAKMVDNTYQSSEGYITIIK